MTNANGSVSIFGNSGRSVPGGGAFSSYVVGPRNNFQVGSFGFHNRKPFGGFEYFLSGGIENGKRYNKDGVFLGFAPHGGESSLLNAVTGVGAIGAIKGASLLVEESIAVKVGSEMKAIGTARTNLLNAVENPKLKNIVNDLYRSGAKVGNGSSMDAFRLEQLTGGTVGGKTHSIKLLNYRVALQRVWNNRANLSAGDRQIVKQLLGDIQNALSGH